eukprot:16452336-Heterocapsa_arctica.AAC.1
MKGHAKFKVWSTTEKIDKLCAGLARQAMEDIKHLSKMGAVRMSKNEVMDFLETNNSTEGYHVRMVCVNKPRDFCLAYIMYEEMGDNILAMALELCLEDTEAIWTSQSMKGIMAKCILALGYIYQTHDCDQLEGIMDLVVWLERSVQKSGDHKEHRKQHGGRKGGEQERVSQGDQHAEGFGRSSDTGKPGTSQEDQICDEGAAGGDLRKHREKHREGQQDRGEQEEEEGHRRLQGTGKRRGGSLGHQRECGQGDQDGRGIRQEQRQQEARGWSRTRYGGSETAHERGENDKRAEGREVPRAAAKSKGGNGGFDEGAGKGGIGQVGDGEAQSKDRGKQNGHFRAKRYGGTMGHNDDTGPGDYHQNMDHNIRGDQQGDADQGTGRRCFQTRGEGTHEHREGHAQEMLRCDDKRKTGKAKGEAKQGEQVQCGGKRQIRMGAIWRNLSLVQATAHAGDKRPGGHDRGQFLEHDTAHAELRHEKVLLQRQVLAETWNGNDQSGSRERGADTERRRQGARKRGEETVGLTDSVEQFEGSDRSYNGMDHTKERRLGGDRFRELSEGRFGGRWRSRARRLVRLEVSQRQRRQEVLRGKPQAQRNSAQKESNKDNKEESLPVYIKDKSDGLQRPKQYSHHNDEDRTTFEIYLSTRHGVFAQQLDYGQSRQQRKKGKDDNYHIPKLFTNFSVADYKHKVMVNLKLSAQRRENRFVKLPQPDCTGSKREQGTNGEGRSRIHKGEEEGEQQQ